MATCDNTESSLYTVLKCTLQTLIAVRIYVLQHWECKNRTSSCNQKSHIRQQSTRPLGNVRSWYIHSCLIRIYVCVCSELSWALLSKLTTIHQHCQSSHCHAVDNTTGKHSRLIEVLIREADNSRRALWQEQLSCFKRKTWVSRECALRDTIQSIAFLWRDVPSHV